MLVLVEIDLFGSLTSCTGELVELVGRNTEGFKTVNDPRSVCADPRNPQCYWVGDLTSIRYCDGKSITLLAGGEKAGYQDGTAENALFDTVEGMACTQNGDKLFVTDCGNNRIRMVDTKTGEVKSIAGNGNRYDGIGLDARIYQPRNLLFDHSPTAKPASILFCTSAGGICRFDIETGSLSTLALNLAVANPYGIDRTPTGHLVVSSINTSSIYCVDPSTGDVRLLTGPGTVASGFVDGPNQQARFHSPRSIVVIDTERCAYVTDFLNGCIRRVTLPLDLFCVAGRDSIIPSAPSNRNTELAIVSSSVPALLIAASADDSKHPTDASVVRDVSACPAVGMKQIQSDINSVWNEVIRLSDGWKGIASGAANGRVDAIGPNATSIKSMRLMTAALLGTDSPMCCADMI